MLALALALPALAALPDLPICKPPEAHARPVLDPTRPPAEPGEKEIRDAFGEFDNSITSDNFVLKWGDEIDVDEDAARDMLDAFEESWDVYTGDWGMPAPEGTDTHLFNVYIGNSGYPAPDIYGAFGYYTVDYDYWPIIVMLPELLEDEDFADSVAAHEFQHAIQDATNNFTGWTERWYLEASATWAAAEVYPDNIYAPKYLFAYTFEPQMALETWEYDGKGLDTLHCYGAFIWNRYLQEFTPNEDIIVESWLDPRAGHDPVEAHEDLLEDEDLVVEDVFAEFAAHNVLMDYERQDLYLQILEGWDSSYGSHAISKTLGSSGDVDWQEGPEGYQPEVWSANVIKVEEPMAGEWLLGFEGDGVGDEDTEAAWRLWTVTVVDGEPVYEDVALDSGFAEWTWEASGEEDALYLVPTVSGKKYIEGESFGYSYLAGNTTVRFFGRAADDDDEDLPNRVCGAVTGSAGLGALLVPLAGLALRRRRG